MVVLARPLKQRLQTVFDRLIPSAQQPILPSTTASTEFVTEAGRPSLLRKAAQLGWLLNLILAISLFIVGYIALFGQGVAAFETTLDSLAIDAVFPNFLTKRIPSALFTYQMFIQVIIFVLVGLFIFWQKPNSLIALLTSAMLINVGLGFTPNLLFLPFVRPNWTFPYILWQVYLYVTGILFLYLFPNGQFTSNRARWLAGPLCWLHPFVASI